MHELDKQKELDGLRAQLRQVEADQAALAEIRAQFAGLLPEFEVLSENLGLFADTWNEVRYPNYSSLSCLSGDRSSITRLSILRLNSKN